MAETDESTDRVGEHGREFERLALLGALVLIALCLLVRESRVLAPEADLTSVDAERLVRVNIGGEPRAPAPPPRPQPPPPEPARDRNLAGERHVDGPPAATSPPSAERFYVVKSGDSLSRIAQRELGSAQRAPEIARLNGITDPDRIRAGQKLRLPAE